MSDPDMGAHATRERAGQLFAQGRYARARALYRQHLAETPTPQPMVWLRCADCSVRLGEPDTAAADYHRAARAFQDQGHTTRAVATLKLVLKLRPDDVPTLLTIIRYERAATERATLPPLVQGTLPADAAAPSAFLALSGTRVAVQAQRGGSWQVLDAAAGDTDLAA